MAQHFAYLSQLDTVPADGFYKISISPAIAGYLKSDFSDIRLYDSASQEVPYLLQREEPVQYKQLFKEYEIVSRISKPLSGTSLVLRNASRSNINNISLIIQNTNAAKKAQLSGSNNGRDWYTIDDQFIIQPTRSQSATSEVKALDFPLSDYEFYKLDINDSLSAPIHIIKAGYYDTYAENGKYTQIEGLQLTQRDSSALRQTFVHIHLKQPVSVDKLQINVTSPVYYMRQVEIKAVQKIKDKRKREQSYYQTVASAVLNSSADNVIFPDTLYTQDFYLLIHNEDNVPLQMSEVKAYQLNTYMIAFLKRGENYQLKFGQAGLNAPHYDLAYFKDKLPVNIPAIQANTIQPVASQQTIPNSGTAWFNNKMLLWATLGIVILLLGYMSFQMVKDMKSNQ
jgi:hypothetical protein